MPPDDEFYCSTRKVVTDGRVRFDVKCRSLFNNLSDPLSKTDMQSETLSPVGREVLDFKNTQINSIKCFPTNSSKYRCDDTGSSFGIESGVQSQFDLDEKIEVFKDEEIERYPMVLISKLEENDIISILKKEIKEIDWDKVSDDWVVDKLINKFTWTTKQIKLNPYKDCDKDSNPLYMHKGWLEKLYNGLNLSDGKIAKLCGFRSSRSIWDWRKRHGIDAKKELEYYIDEQGYKNILMPPDYRHPQIATTPRQTLGEHRIVMERFMMQNPDLEISKKYLIDGKYLTLGTIVHHINQVKSDNRIKNLWLYPNKKEHHTQAKSSLNECLSALIKIKQIIFSNGKYKFDNSFDYRNRYNKREIQEIIRLVEFKVPFENIDEIKEEIKERDWEKISDNWKVFINKYRTSAGSGEETMLLDPYSDCSNSNPLYMHKGWLETIVNDNRFNLTEPRLGELCGISRGMAHYWRETIHKIKRAKIGFIRFLDATGYIRIKVPDSYKNPFVQKLKIPFNIMREHRYIAERSLAKSSNSELKKRFLIDGKYLPPHIHVHHINLDKLDNRPENLYITDDHKMIHSQLSSLLDQLMKNDLIGFKKGRYFLL
ncbi:MAG: hypothetical protein EU529_17075 [Promethearchaeota archaeon]|nr:MAG: hypothetical protein EU529_17075 [Candidatus Lokiarchaeota archaeon]